MPRRKQSSRRDPDRRPAPKATFMRRKVRGSKDQVVSWMHDDTQFLVICIGADGELSAYIDKVE